MKENLGSATEEPEIPIDVELGPQSEPVTLRRAMHPAAARAHPLEADGLDLGVAPGDVVAGKYKVERLLGIGGMGAVVAATHVQLDTKVAIKFLLPSMLDNRDAVGRFAREAKAAAKITTEHVARTLDVGTLKTGAPFIVMEFLEGGNLAAWLEQRGPLRVEHAVDFILQACVAVAEAHALGIVHRDLKPENLFCVRRPDGEPSIKVLDFGISKVTGNQGLTLSRMTVTKTAVVMGSPLYMSPEQMRSAKSANAQSDIWALGVILYELLAGKVPFEGDTVTEVAIKVAMTAAAPIHGLRPDVPAGLEAVVGKCLEKDRRHRYDNVGELAVALAPFATNKAIAYVERIVRTVQAAGLSVLPFEMPPSVPPLEERSIAPAYRTTPDVPQTERGARAVVALTLVSIIVLGGAGVAWDRKHVANPVPARATTSGTPAVVSMALPAGSIPAASPVTLPPIPTASTLPTLAVEAGAPTAPVASTPARPRAPVDAGPVSLPPLAPDLK